MSRLPQFLPDLPDDVIDVLRGMGADLTAREWSFRLDVSPAVVKACAERADVRLPDDRRWNPGPSPRFVGEEAKRIRAEREAGAKLIELCARWGAGPYAIRAALRRAA